MNENEENVIVKTKTNKGIIILLVILILMVIGLSAYVVYDKVISKDETNENVENKNEEEKIEEEEELPEKSSEHTYLDMNKKNIMLNNKNHTLITYYYKETLNDDITIYGIYEEVYFDGKKVINMFMKDAFMTEQERDSSISNSEETTKIIKDINNDREYLLLEYYQTNDVRDIALDHKVRKAKLIDDNSNVLDDYYISYPCPTASVYINYDGSNLYTQSYLDIHDNFMYYLDTSSGMNRMLDTIDEYKITIENGKINKVKIKTYVGDQIQAAGGC